MGGGGEIVKDQTHNWKDGGNENHRKEHFSGSLRSGRN